MPVIVTHHPQGTVSPFAAAGVEPTQRGGQPVSPLEPVTALFPEVWTPDALCAARERFAGRSFAAEYQQIPFDEEAARQRDLDEQHHADYRAWLRSRTAPTSPQDAPEPSDVSGHGEGRQDARAGLSLAERGTE